MRAPDRLAVLVCAALAAATPMLAGTLAWRYVDEWQQTGALFYALYWPSVAIEQLPDAARRAFTMSALPTVLLYFAGYLLVFQAVRAAVARGVGRGKRPRA